MLALQCRVGTERRHGHKRRASSEGVASPAQAADGDAATARAAATTACDAVAAAILGALQQRMDLPQRDAGLAFWTSCIAALNAQVSFQGLGFGVAFTSFILDCSCLGAASPPHKSSMLAAAFPSAKCPPQRTN